MAHRPLGLRLIDLFEDGIAGATVDRRVARCLRTVGLQRARVACMNSHGLLRSAWVPWLSITLRTSPMPDEPPLWSGCEPDDDRVRLAVERNQRRAAISSADERCIAAEQCEPVEYAEGLYTGPTASSRNGK